MKHHIPFKSILSLFKPLLLVWLGILLGQAIYAQQMPSKLAEAELKGVGLGSQMWVFNRFDEQRRSYQK